MIARSLWFYEINPLAISPGQLPAGHLPPKDIYLPRKIPPDDNQPRGQIHPWTITPLKITHWTIPHTENYPLRQ